MDSALLYLFVWALASLHVWGQCEWGEWVNQACVRALVSRRSRQPGWRWRWPGEWQGGHNHLTLEKQSDTKGFNALPWVWATAIGFDSRVIMRGGRLEVFNGQGLEEKRGDVETGKRRRISLSVGISASAILDVGLSRLLNSPSSHLRWFPFTKGTKGGSLERTILEVTPTLCFWACFTPDF